jgi:hypothetical protein
MSEIERYRQRGSLNRPNRELARISGATDIEMAIVQAKAELEIAKLDGLQAVAGRAMQGVALVSQLEQQLAQTVPLAASRLQAIGDMHSLATAEILASTARRLS